MNPYLTKKAMPAWFVVFAENLACIAAVLLVGFLCLTAVHGVMQDGLVIGPLLILALLVGLLIALLCWLTERKRARVHARVITSALCMAEKGSIPFAELMKATRINKLEMVIAKLSYKGYIRNVAVIRSDVCLTDRMEETAE